MRRVAPLLSLVMLVSACAGTGAEPSTTTVAANPVTTTTAVATTTTTQATTTTAETTTTTMDPELLEPLLGQWYILRYSSQSGGFWAHSVLEFNQNGVVIRAHGPQRALSSTQNRGRFFLDEDVFEFSMSYPGCGWDATYRLTWESDDRITLDAIDDTCTIRLFHLGGTHDRRTEEAIQDLRQRNVGTRFEWTDE